MVAELLRGTERGEEEGCAERRLGGQELDREVFLSLFQILALNPQIRARKRTKSTLPLPFSFVEKGKVASSPVSWSRSRRKAWCGRFGLPSSVAVKMILRVSCAPRETSLERGTWSESLYEVKD
jgi:hypothetical protein